MRSRFLLFGILVGMVVLVGAAAPDWIDGASGVNYTTAEGEVYYHNFSANITGFSDDINFSIDTEKDISWTNISGTYLVEQSVVSDWILIIDADSGNFSINATYDNQTGFFTIPIQATNTSAEGGAIIEDFEFIINATNDLPNFTLNSDYNVSVPGTGNTSLNISLVGSDEEEQYPLEYNLSFVNCSFADWSSRNNSNCSLDYSIIEVDNTTSISAFTNLTYNDVGVYNLTYCVHDNVNATSLPLYYDSSYTENKTTCVNTTLNLLSSLSVDVTNCTGATVMEGDTFNCTINVTTIEENDELDFSSLATFRGGGAYTGDASWLYSDVTDNASSFFYSLPISITPTKENVGNWTINFSVDDGSSQEIGEILIFVNYTESNVSLDAISNLTLYEDGNFSVNAYDEDLLIQDDDVKDEILTFASNTSWVSAGTASTTSGNNYSTSLISIDYDAALLLGEGNYSVLINVTDVIGNVDSQIFVVEIVNATVPVWNVSLDYPVVLNLTEDVLFTYNVSVNVSDSGETITFYYENVSEEFCSLNATNFNLSGMVNFTPVDCDVGFHNVSIIATNGKLNSSWNFVFNISNVADVPSVDTFTGDNGTQEDLDENFNFIVGEGVVANFSLRIADDDFLIPSGQRDDYYNESLIVETTFTNSTGGNVSLFNFSFIEFDTILEVAKYNATFTPGVAEVGNYAVFVNITDASGNSTNRTWFLNVTEVLDAPVLENISNVSLTIYDSFNFTVNATDDEDDFDGKALNYSIMALDVGAPALTIGITNGSVEFDMASNVSAAGEWDYNISVNDSDGMVDWQVFYLFVYGNASLVSPAEDYIFSLTENVSSTLNFTINHSMGDNLTYEFWIDNMSCSYQNNSNCTYGNLSFRSLVNSFGNGSVSSWNFTPDFSDETYGNLKNLTVSVYPNSTELNSSQRAAVASNFSFKLNISHTNAPMRAIAPIGLLQSDYNTPINLDLSSYFADEDVSDSYYSQNVTFVKSAGHADISVSHSSGWNIVIGTIIDAAFSGFITINGSDNLTSDVIEDVEISFTVPSTTTSSGGSSGSSTKLKFYSLRIIVPEDIIISDENYIEVPFGLENNAEIDLKGINLTSEVLYNNAFSSDVRIDIGETYIDILKFGERRDFTMRIFADTDRSGRYKATVFADVASPKFDDWADFFIDLRRTNESEATEMLVFTEKIISDNPECLELTEVFRRAKEAFDGGDEAEAVRLAQEVSEACEDAISANEQIKYRIEGFVERNFYYISFLTLMIFFAGFVLYVYKRVRFNKSVEDLYVK